MEESSTEVLGITATKVRFRVYLKMYSVEGSIID